MHDSSTTQGRLQRQSAAEQIKEFGGVDLLDAGLRAAARGCAIFPCNGKKEPLTAHGFKDATTDEQQIRTWAKRYPGALWGYALPKEIVVLDLDMKQGLNGFRDFEELQNCKPEEFLAPSVATPSGGMHLYTDPNGQEFHGTVGKIAPGIDTRTLGNYVCIPSGPKCGYRWLNNIEILPPTPEWVKATLHVNSNFEAIANAQTYAGPSPFGNLMLENACDAIRTASNSKQELTLSLKALHMGHYVGGGLLDRDPTIEALVHAGLQMVDYDPHYEWTEKEIRKKVERRVDAGRRQPWDDGSELDRRTQRNMDRVFNDPQYAKEVEDFWKKMTPSGPLNRLRSRPQNTLNHGKRLSGNSHSRSLHRTYPSASSSPSRSNHRLPRPHSFAAWARAFLRLSLFWSASFSTR